MCFIHFHRKIHDSNYIFGDRNIIVCCPPLMVFEKEIPSKQKDMPNIHIEKTTIAVLLKYIYSLSLALLGF